MDWPPSAAPAIRPSSRCAEPRRSRRTPPAPLPGGELGVQGGELGFRIYADPAGHPFCLEFET